MTGLALIVPELILLATALLALFADVIFRGRARAAVWVGAVGSALAAGAAWLGGQGSTAAFGGAFAVDGAGQVARVLTGVLTSVFIVWLAGAGLRGSGVQTAARVGGEESTQPGGERAFTSLVLFAALGAMLMSAARDWVVLLLAVEVATMPAYVLMGFDRRDDRGLEGSLKYFLLSMISSALLFYGLSFVIGMSGVTAMSATRLESGLIGMLAAAFISAGLLAKLSAAPFQWWAPDAYAGAPAASVAFVSAVPKIAGLLAFARVVMVLQPQVSSMQMLLVGAALLSMVVGNLAAYPQSDLRRLMAYSGVAHAGYLLVGLAAGSSAGLGAALFYAVAYAVPSMGVMLVVAQHGTSIEDVRGLARRRPLDAWLTVLMLLSLIGVPPLAGFIGKLYLFTAAMNAGLTWIAVVAIVMSAVSAGFYFRIIRAMFFETTDAPVDIAREAAPRSFAGSAAIVACALATLAMGVVSSPLLGAISLR